MRKDNWEFGLGPDKFETFSTHLFWFVISNSKLNGIKQPFYYPQEFCGSGIWAENSWMTSQFYYV